MRTIEVIGEEWLQLRRYQRLSIASGKASAFRDAVSPEASVAPACSEQPGPIVQRDPHLLSKDTPRDCDGAGPQGEFFMFQ